MPQLRTDGMIICRIATNCIGGKAHVTSMGIGNRIQIRAMGFYRVLSMLCDMAMSGQLRWLYGDGTYHAVSIIFMRVSSSLL